jgi:sulfite reductase beta subunit-like hemoprotein
VKFFAEARERADFAAWARTNAAPQRDPERRAVTVVLPLGDIGSAPLRALGRLARRFGDGTLRATEGLTVVGAAELLRPFA